jgi:hypothetical protein
MEEIEENLTRLKRQLQSKLSHDYEEYVLFVEAVINGRISRKEADVLLKRIIPAGLHSTLSLFCGALPSHISHP